MIEKEILAEQGQSNEKAIPDVYSKDYGYLWYDEDVSIRDTDIVKLYICDKYIELQAHSMQFHKDEEFYVGSSSVIIFLQYKIATELLIGLGYEIYNTIEGGLTLANLDDNVITKVGWARREIWTKKVDCKPFRFIDDYEHGEEK